MNENKIKRRDVLGSINHAAAVNFKQQNSKVKTTLRVKGQRSQSNAASFTWAIESHVIYKYTNN